MHFPELTYSQDAIMPVPCFLLFLCFRKVTQEIFSELDETKAKPPNIYRSFQKTKEETEGAMGQPHHRAARPAPGPRPLVVRCNIPSFYQNLEQFFLFCFVSIDLKILGN
jgi:hypothetical protein